METKPTGEEKVSDEEVDEKMLKLSKQLQTVVTQTLSPRIVRSIVENMVTNMLTPFIRERLDKAEIENTIHLEILRTVGPFLEGEVIATDMRQVIQAAIVNQVKTLISNSVSDIIRAELGLIMGELKQQALIVADLTRQVTLQQGQISVLMNRGKE